MILQIETCCNIFEMAQWVAKREREIENIVDAPL